MQPEFCGLVMAGPASPRSGEGDMVLLEDGRLLFAYGHFGGLEDDDRCPSEGVHPR